MYEGKCATKKCRQNCNNRNPKEVWWRLPRSVPYRRDQYSIRLYSLFVHVVGGGGGGAQWARRPDNEKHEIKNKVLKTQADSPKLRPCCKETQGINRNSVKLTIIQFKVNFI